MNQLKQKTINRCKSVWKKICNPPIVDVDELVIGDNVIIEPGVVIRSDRMVVGDGAVIKAGTYISSPDIVIGDYTVINDNCRITGTDYCYIGHNCWIGHFSIIDSIGGTRLGNGVGVGAHSQLWSHINFGDILEGCRFASQNPLIIDDDVWFVGHCIVAPIHAKKRSMALSGSVVTKDMEENHVYAGVPSKDVTEYMGNQFEITSIDQKKVILNKYLNDFVNIYHPIKNRIRIVEKIDINDTQYSQFSLTERFYIKNLYPEEVNFVRYLLPTKAKFLPHPKTDWVLPFL